MVRKVIRIGLHEIQTIDVTCQYCDTMIRYDIKKQPRQICQNCNNDFPDEVFKGLGNLHMAFRYLHQDEKHTTTFEIELKEDH